MSDRNWVKKILKGDKIAGEQFVTDLYPRIYRLLRNLTGDTETAQDLTQQTFTQAWQKLETYQGRASLSTWLHRVAYHEYTHWLRSRRDWVSLDNALDVADLRTFEGLTTVLLRRALAELSADLRETFLLFHIQELSVAEVAIIMDVPAGTIKSRLFTARRRLRELLSESLPDALPKQAAIIPLIRTPEPKESISNGLSTNQTQHELR